MQGEPLNVVVVGAGRIAQAAHLPAIAATPEVRLLGVCDPRADLREAVCGAYGGVRAYSSLEAVLADDRVEAVHLCLPIPEHAPAAVTALEAGRHVLVEKPLAASAAEGRRILAAARRSGRRVMAGYHKRYDAGCEWARGRMAEIGAPTYLCYRFGTTDWLAPSAAPRFSSALPPPPSTPWDWPDGADTPERRRFYTLLLDMFSHMSNLLRWLLDTRPEVEWARVGSGPPPGGGKWDGMTRGIVALRFGQAPGLLVEGPHYAVERGWNEYCEIWGPGGRLELELPPNAWVNASARARLWRAASGERVEHEPAWAWAFQREIAHFARRVRSGDAFRTEAEDALIDLELAEAACSFV